MSGTHGPDFLPVGMQQRGQTKVEPVYLSPDLASGYNMLWFWKKNKKTKIKATPQALFCNNFHSFSNYGERLDEWGHVLLQKSGLCCVTRVKSLVQTTPNHIKLLMEKKTVKV